MDKVKEIVDVFSPETLGESLINETSEVTRDQLKGKILAYNDLQFGIKAAEGKELSKFKDFVERMEPYGDNLTAFVQVVDPRAERVFASKIKALQLLKANLLTYLNDYASGTTEQAEADSGIHSEEVEKEAVDEGKATQGKIPNGSKGGK